MSERQKVVGYLNKQPPIALGI
jgi:hypothetical protein